MPSRGTAATLSLGMDIGMQQTQHPGNDSNEGCVAADRAAWCRCYL